MYYHVFIFERKKRYKTLFAEFANKNKIDISKYVTVEELDKIMYNLKPKQNKHALLCKFLFLTTYCFVKIW